MCGLFLLLLVFKLYDDTQMQFLSMKKSRYFLGEFLMKKIHELHIVIFYDNTQDS